MIDAIERVAGAGLGSPISLLRDERPDPKAFAQASYDALLDPPDPCGLPLTTRAAVACRVAELHEAVALADHYRDRADNFDIATLPQSVRDHIDRLSTDPAAARRAHVEAVLVTGMTPRDLVSLSQLIAFVAFQARLLVGVRLQAEATGPEGGARPADAPADLGWTLDPLEWSSWLPTVSLDTASADQLAVLEESNPRAKTSPYYLMLVHNPEALRQRSRLFNSVMYGQGGLPRADRELAAAAESRINGCVYCASVHARLFAQLTKEPEVIEHIYTEGTQTELAPRRRAIVDYSVHLAATPPTPHRAHIDTLRAAGLAEIEILDVTHVVAMFAWANRLMQTLGEPVRPPPAARSGIPA